MVASSVDIPIIANGGSRDIHSHDDIYKFRDLCGADSVMVARAAQLNVSIFRKEGILPMDELIEKYLRLCVDYDNAPHNAKYCVQGMLKELQETPRGKRFLQCQTLQQICEIWNLGDYCRRRQQELKSQGNVGRADVEPLHDMNKRPKLDNEALEKLSDVFEGVINRNMPFLRSTYANGKCVIKLSHLIINNKITKMFFL